jgi:hypothetical protein
MQSILASKKRLNWPKQSLQSLWTLYSARRYVIESRLRMKRTLLAVGVAILASMMWIPVHNPYSQSYERVIILELFGGYDVQWGPMILQTIFVAVVFAVIVNLFPHRPRR